jgi:hypothetical protein
MRTVIAGEVMAKDELMKQAPHETKLSNVILGWARKATQGDVPHNLLEVFKSGIQVAMLWKIEE